MDAARFQDEANSRLWRRDLVRPYAGRWLNPAEQAVLDAFREDFSGRTLELGCGAGRVTAHMAELSPDVHAIDISPRMVEHCRQSLPGVTVSLGDIRDLSGLEPASFAVVAAWCNVIDVLDDAARRATLEQAAALVAPGGLLVVCTHNLAFAPNIRTPLQLRRGSARELAGDLARLPASLYHHRRVRPHEVRADGYAILNDVSHHFMALHYYVSQELQREQLDEVGLRLVEIRAGDGRVVTDGDPATESADLHYVARRPA